MLRFGVKNHNIFAAVESLIRYIIGFILLDNIVADWSSPLANFRVILVGVTWSLTCEILFYLIFPFIIVFSKLKSILPLLVIGTFIINIYSGSNAVYFSEFGHFDAFFLGILISFYNKQVNIKSKVLIFLYILSLAIIFFISPRTTGKGSDYLHVLLVCGFLVYSVTLNRDIINLSFVGKLLSFIGRRSYFIYLMHLTIAYVMRKPLNYLFTHLASYSLYLKKLILKDTKILHIQNIIIFFIIIICADLFYRYIEQPFIKKFRIIIMTQNNLIENYAVALFNNAKMDNIVDKIFDEITLVNSFIEDNFKIKEFLFSPVIDKTDKIKLINSLVKSIKISTMLQNFLLLLIKNSRTNILSDIVEAYNRLLCKSKNIKIVQIVSASKLQPKEQEWIKASLEKELKQETKINFEVDPTIIGGIIIKYDSILQDYSIKNSLAKIATTLKSVRVAA